jgi:hypothetical protein
VVDAVVISVYRNTILSKVTFILGYATKQAEDCAFYTDQAPAQPIAPVHGDPHALVPFAIEDGGRLGAHELALLRALAVVALEKRKTPSLRLQSIGDLRPLPFVLVGLAVVLSLVFMTPFGPFKACPQALAH